MIQQQDLKAELERHPPDQPAHRACPEIAHAIRAQMQNILDEWRGRTILSLPELADLTKQDFIDDAEKILIALADALESNEATDLRKLVQTAPQHGFQRFLLDFDLAEVFAEERILRRVVVERVEEELNRACTSDEAKALHGMIDLMLQQGVMALALRQREELRQSAEAELKYLSFLSHDLGNNLFVITSRLELLQRRLRNMPELQETAETVSAALKVISRTTQGMRTLLAHERLRRSDGTALIGPVNLLDVVHSIVSVYQDDALSDGCALDVSIDEQAVANTDVSLLTIILQNLISNAIKHTCENGGGMVRIQAEHRPPALLESSKVDHKGLWKISVIDNGPGIAAEKVEVLFQPFKQLRDHAGPPDANALSALAGDGDKMHVGLGLAIASQAATMLGTGIDVQSKPGQGATFSIMLPAR